MTKRQTLTAALMLWILFFLASCNGLDVDLDNAVSGEDGEVVRGELLFNQPRIGAAEAPGCVTCHALEEGVVIVGPSQAGMAARAGQAIPGVDAANYLRQSIVEPDAHIVGGFTEGVMYPNYGAELTDDEIESLVAFMLTLE